MLNEVLTLTVTWNGLDFYGSQIVAVNPTSGRHGVLPMPSSIDYDSSIFTNHIVLRNNRGRL